MDGGGEFADITNNPRKRKRNEKEWAKKQTKEEKNSSAGKRPAIGCQHMPHSFCKAALLTEGDITDTFQDCYRDSNKLRQDSFITCHFQLHPIMRHRGNGPQPARERNYAPTFKITTQEGENVGVCSGSFRSILALGRKRLGNLMKYAWQNNSNPRPERRGGRRVSEEFNQLKEKIRDHIKAFRCCSSHYGRNKTPHKRYLPGSLNIQKMWELFKKEHPEQQVKYHTYYTVFVQDFNLGFGNPKTDVCSFCTGHKTKLSYEEDEEKKRTLVTELLVHRSRSRKFYQLMSTKPDDSTLLLSFDLMQNQALPKSPIGEAYYARQLWLYVLGIIEHKPSGERGIPGEQSQEDVNFYTWGEQEMGRGANQVASALKHFLDTRLPQSPHVTKVVLFSDSCVGQNKNCVVLGMLNLVSTAHKVEFEHIFPVRGHSYMPADRAFGRVEKRLRREETILLPSGYLAHFATVGNVRVHGRDWHALDLKNAVEKTVKRPLPFKITEAKRIYVRPAPAPVTVSTFYSAPGAEHTILKRGKKWCTLQVDRLQLKSCVKPAKQRDVAKLLKAMGVELVEPLVGSGPRTFLQEVGVFYKEVCEPTDAMDIDSDEEDEGIIAVYED